MKNIIDPFDGAQNNVTSGGIVDPFDSPAVDDEKKKKRSALDAVKEGVLGLWDSYGQGANELAAGVGTFSQAPAENTLSGLAGAGALVARKARDWTGVDIGADAAAEASRTASDFAREARNGNALFGAGSVGKALEEAGRSGAAHYAAEKQSDAPEMVAQQKAISDAEGFWGTLSAIADNKTGMLGTLAQSMPDMALGAGAGRLAAIKAGAAAEKSALASGLAPDLARAAGVTAAEKSASFVGVTSEASSSGLHGREGSYQFVQNIPEEKLSQSQRYQELVAQTGDKAKAREMLANEIADQVPLITSAGTAAGTVITNKLFGGDATAKTLAGGERMTARQFGSRTAQDTIEEGIQGVPEDYTQHSALVQADPEHKFDLGGTLAQNMAAGFGMGAGGHGAGFVSSNMGKGGEAGPSGPGGSDALPADQVLGAATPKTEAEKALLTPKNISALDRAHEIGSRLGEIAMGEATPDSQAEVNQLTAERDQITAAWPKSVPGTNTTFSTEAGARLEGQYALMEAGDLTASHDTNLRKSPTYPPELQPRERDRAASEMQVSGIVQKLDPARLGESPDAANGAPIVGADGLVESGNARTIALQRIYQANGLKAEEYKQFIKGNAERFGITPESVDGMSKPVLVRVRSTPVNRAEFARQANAATVAQMSPSEQARADSSRMDSMDGLTPDENGDFTSSTSRDFVRRFMARVPGTEQAGMIDANGALSQTGYARIRNAVLAKAYGDSPVLLRMVESLDDNLKNVTRALMRAAPQVAQARQDINDGALHDADIVPDLMAAVEELSTLKDKGISVDQALAQAGMFGDQYSPETRELLQFLADNLRKPRVMSEFILNYYQALQAAGNPGQGSLLGDTVAPSKAELMQSAKGDQNGTNTAVDGATLPADQEAGAEHRGQPGDETGDQAGAQGDETGRAKADLEFSDALNGLDAITHKFVNNSRAVPESTPGLMDALERLFNSTVKMGHNDSKQALAYAKEKMRADTRFKTAWNRIMPETYRKAAKVVDAAQNLTDVSTKPEKVDTSIVVKQPYGVNTLGGLAEFDQAKEIASSATENTIFRVRIEKEGLYEHEPVKTLYGAFVANGDGTATWAQARFPASKENPSDAQIMELAEADRLSNKETAEKIAENTRKNKAALAEKGIVVGLELQSPSAYVAGKKGMTTFTRAKVVAIDDNGIAEVHATLKGSGKAYVFKTDANSRLFEKLDAKPTAQDGNVRPFSEVRPYLDSNVFGKGKGEEVPDARFAVGTLPADTIAEIEKFIDGFSDKFALVRISGRALKHTDEQRHGELDAVIDSLPKIIEGKAEVLHNPTRENSAFIVYESDSNYLVVLEVAKNGNATDVVNIITTRDRGLKQYRKKSAEWLDGRRSHHPVNPKIPAEGEISVFQPSGTDNVPQPSAESKLATPEQQAAAILDRANVTGKDRLDIMRDFKDGKHSISDLESAYPAKDNTDRVADAGKPMETAQEAKNDEAKGNTLDSGAELTHNKRNRLTRGLKWEDVADKNDTLRVSEVTKAKVYPKPDYQGMVDDGINPLIVHMVKQAYDAISIKPQVRGTPTDENLKLYISAVNRHMDGVMAWANDSEQTAAFLKKLADKANAYRGMDVISSMQERASDTSKTLLDHVYPGEWKSFKDEIRILGGNKAYGALQPSTDDAVKAMKDIEKGWPGKTEAWQKSYQVAQEGDKWFVAMTGKSTFKYRIVDKLKDGFDTQEEAIEAARNLVKREKNDNEIQEKGWSVASAKREGVARRMEGEDISSDKLKETFGFKGVNFGNWMKSGSKSMLAERQAHLNHAYDAFLDLAEIVGVPPKAMSLNGMLGIAIGAQGSGKALAHFVPGVNEINLTRTGGAGALSHEWAHALDHYFATLAGLGRAKEPFLTEHVSTPHGEVVTENGRQVMREVPFAEGLRPEVLDQFKAVVQAMTRTMSVAPTKEEAHAQAESRMARAERDVELWLKSIRRDFERAATSANRPGISAESSAGKAEAALKNGLLDKFDEIANRIRTGDVGDGLIAASSSKSISPVIVEMRDLYKKATGRAYSLDDSYGLHMNVGFLKLLKDGTYANEEHVPRAINSNYLTASNAADHQTKRNYWATKLEMFARAFDAYVVDTLAEKAAKNTYLSGIEAVPPLGEERKVIGKAFDFLLAELKTKETDQGTAIYSTQPVDAIPESEWLSVGAIVEEVDQLLKPFATEIPVLIRDTLADIGVKTADDGVTSGAVHGGRIHLFRDGLADRSAVARTLWHELLHFGFRRFMTEEQYISKMGDLYMRDGWLRGKATEWMESAEAKKLAETKKPGYVRARAVDEALAELAEIMQTEPTGYRNNTKLAQTKRTVSEWIARLADFFGFKEAAQAWRGYAAQKDARDLLVSTFAKLREGAPPSTLNSRWHYSDPAFMTAWHGSPHDHDKFDSAKIGTGEGVQAYGFGHYFAGSRDVAEWYKKKLSGLSFTRNGERLSPANWAATSTPEEIADSHAIGRLLYALKNANVKYLDGHSIAASATSLASGAEEYARAYNDPAASKRESMIAERLLQFAEDAKSGALKATQGNLYQVELAPAQEDYIDWDKPLSEQSEKVKAALKVGPDGIGYNGNMDGDSIYRDVSKTLGNDKAASEYLLSIGIRGIKYLDGSSRSAGEGSHNFVIFDDADVSIVAKLSRGDGTSAGMKLSALESVRDRIAAKLKNLPKVHLFANPAADGVPAALRAEIERQGAMKDAEGAMHDGELYLFADHIADEARAEFVLAEHEVTHLGLRAVLGKDLDQVLQAIFNTNAAVRKAAAPLKARGKLSDIAATEEVLADMPSKDLVKLKGWRKVTMMVRDWLAGHGFDKLASKLDAWLKGGLDEQGKADLLVSDLVRAAREWARSGKPKKVSGTMLSGEVKERKLADDMDAQMKWLTFEAQARGFKDIDDLAGKDYAVFEKLAALWRKKHPADVMLSRKAQELETIDVDGYSSVDVHHREDGYVSFSATTKVSGQPYFTNIMLRQNDEGKWVGGTSPRHETFTGKTVRAEARHSLNDKAEVLREAAINYLSESNDGNIRLSRSAQNKSTAERADEIIAKNAGTWRPLDATMKAAVQMVGIDRLTTGIYNKAGFLLDRHTPETIKAGMVSDYGIPDAVIDQRALMQGSKRQQLRKAGALIEKLSTLTREESRIAYEWMNSDDPQSAEYFRQQLPEESIKVMAEVEKMIDALSKEAVALGQLSPDAFKRNRFAYLRRSYVKHTVELTKSEATGRARAIAVLGDQYKNRGMSEAVDMQKVQNIAPDWWQRKLKAGQADKGMKGEKLIRLERRAPSGEGTVPMAGIGDRSRGRLLEVAYWPAGEALPAKYNDWSQAGTWKVLDTKGNSLIVWRDFTKQERVSMGEIDEARYAIAKTLHGMIQDVETGRYLQWLGEKYGKTDGGGLNIVEASDRMRDTFKKDEWVQVPDTKIPGTQVLKYGKLAGQFLPGPIWNDVRQVVGGRFKPLGEVFSAVMSAWKTSKTALSPAVHMNNVMANFVMADWHDLTAGHITKALRIMMAASEREGRGVIGRAGNLAARGGIVDREAATEILNRFQDSGGGIGTWITSEIQKEQLEPLLDALEKELASAGQSQGAQVGALAAVQKLMQLKFSESWEAFKPSKGAQAVATEAKSMLALYEAEDQFFRLAAWLKAKEDGATDAVAGHAARNSFLDYHINAPWVSMMRQTALPFVAFSYRAIPMMLDTMAHKPWKMMKLGLVVGMLNALGYAMSGGDEDEERKLLPEEKAGRIWGLVPKLVRMPWNDPHGEPVFLDIRRFVPVGDIFDTGSNHAAIPVLPFMQPGGPLMLLGEVALNKQGFTGKDITLDTDTPVERAQKMADYLYKAFAPNLAILPGTYAWTSIANASKGKTDAFGREQSTAQAIASSVGIKLGSYPKDVLRMNATRAAQAQLMEIGGNVTKLKREYQKSGITQEELIKKAAEQNEKKRKIIQELGAKM